MEKWTSILFIPLTVLFLSMSCAFNRLMEGISFILKHQMLNIYKRFDAVCDGLHFQFSLSDIGLIPLLKQIMKNNIHSLFKIFLLMSGLDFDGLKVVIKLLKKGNLPL